METNSRSPTIPNIGATSSSPGFDTIRREDIESRSVKVDVSALLGGDTYAALRRRDGPALKRFSKKRRDALPPDGLPGRGNAEQRAGSDRAEPGGSPARTGIAADQPAAPAKEEWDI